MSNITRLEYVEGEFPSGMKFKSGLKDGDIRKIQEKGYKVAVLREDYQTSDLEDARKQCQSYEPPKAK